jgi:hypothetical protein
MTDVLEHVGMVVGTQSGGSEELAGDAKGPPAESGATRVKCPVNISAPSVPETCRWCLEALGTCKPNGRKRIYCSQSCRQQAYQSRKRSRQLGLDDRQVVVTSFQLGRIKSRLEKLDDALVAVETSGLHLTDARIAALCEAARGLRGLVIGPRLTCPKVRDSRPSVTASNGTTDLPWAGSRFTLSGVMDS